MDEVLHIGLIIFMTSSFLLIVGEQLFKHHNLMVSLISIISVFIGFQLSSLDTLPIFPLFLGALLILLIGYLNDSGKIDYLRSLIGQLLVMIYLVYSGLVIETSFLVIEGDFLLSVLTIVWLLLIMNATKFINDYFKVSPEILVILMIPMAIITYLEGLVTGFYTSVIMLFIFLFASLYKFRISNSQIGNSTTLLLGYLMAVQSVLGTIKGPVLMGYSLPIFALLLFILVQLKVTNDTRLESIIEKIFDQRHFRIKQVIIYLASIILAQFTLIYYLL